MSTRISSSVMAASCVGRTCSSRNTPSVVAVSSATAGPATAKGSRKDPNKGYSNLDRGKEPSRLLGELERGSSARVALLCELAQAILARRDNGDLRNRQNTIEQEQQHNQQQLGGYGEHGRLSMQPPAPAEWRRRLTGQLNGGTPPSLRRSGSTDCSSVRTHA
jgi:hypothetical protein